MEDTKKANKSKEVEQAKSVKNEKNTQNVKKLENAKNGENVKKTENAKKVESLGNTFGDKIIQGRKKKGMSQEAFADIMNVSRQMVSRWELNTAMPRMQKIRKISEILDISIEDLLSGNENRKLNSPVALNTFNLKKLLKVIAVILAIMLILYVAYSVYKMIILNKISSKLEQYKNLDNYYFKLESLVDGDLKETIETWYKNGKYKISNTTVVNNTPMTSTTYFDINDGYRYIIDETNKTYTQLNLIGAESYENGIYMYSKFPAIIKKEASDFKKLALELNLVFSYYKNDSIFLKINNERIEFNKDNLIPKVQTIKMQANKNVQDNMNKFIVILDSTIESDVSIPKEYRKMN